MINKKTKTLLMGIVASSLILSTPVFAGTIQPTATATTQVSAAVPVGGYNSNIDTNFFTSSSTLIAYLKGVNQGSVNIYNDYVGYQGITSGSKVKVLQCLLCDANIVVAIDGSFGPSTDTAVRNFQSSHGLSADGMVGPNTWKSMMTAAGTFYM
jgi:peptidoglycan hydrolase-like protein with peptidoglycan-binding domain